MLARFIKTAGYCLASVTLLLANGGCAHVGLSAIPQTREGYNKALSDSDNEQFLLNIVRMHFGQTPYFVNVDNMVTQSTLTTGSGVDSQLSSGLAGASPGLVGWRLSPVVQFSQSPTITYSPLQGSQFVAGMLTPITLDKLSLLLQSGWSTAEVMRLMVEQVGKLSNATIALHPLADTTPNQKEFDHFVAVLDRLDIEDRVDYVTTLYKDKNAVVANIADDEAAKEVAEALHLSRPYHQLIFSRSILVGNGSPENVIYVQTRSFFSMLNFLSKGVMACNSLNAKYGIKQIKSDEGHRNLTYGLFAVRESDKEPNVAAAKVSFDDKWYYIPEDDVATKATLVLLRITYALQTGELKANVPLVTIPIK